MSTTNRATDTGAPQAGEPIAGAALSELLAPRTSTDAEHAHALIIERLAEAEAAATAHAEGRDDALIEGTERQHDERAHILADEVRRLTVAAGRLAASRDDLAEVERIEAARAKAKAAMKAAARAEAIVAEHYPAHARAIAGLFEELHDCCATVVAARSAAKAAGLDEEAAVLVLPHERRSCSAEWEEVEVESVNHGARVTDSRGATLSHERHSGNDQSAPTITRRMERQLVRSAYRAPDLTKAVVMLPDAETAHGFIVRQGG